MKMKQINFKTFKKYCTYCIGKYCDNATSNDTCKEEDCKPFNKLKDAEVSK